MARSSGDRINGESLVTKRDKIDLPGVSDDRYIRSDCQSREEEFFQEVGDSFLVAWGVRGFGGCRELDGTK